MTENQKQPNILIVEDDAPSRELMQVLLSEYGLCSCATNGTEAIEAVSKAIEAENPFDLICLDIMMPEMDGLEALKQIRQTEKSHQVDPGKAVKVIMVTTASQEAKVMRAFHYGCNGYLVKPIAKEDLVREMNKLPSGLATNAKWRAHI